MEKGFEGIGGNKEAAQKVGRLSHRKLLEKGISEVVFDRGGYIYHGRVKELAEGARERRPQILKEEGIHLARIDGSTLDLQEKSRCH